MPSAFQSSSNRVRYLSQPHITMKHTLIVKAVNGVNQNPEQANCIGRRNMHINRYIKFVLFVLGGALFVGSAISQVPKQHSGEARQMSVASPNALKWVPIRPGNEMAVVYGDPSKAGEMYAVRFGSQTGSRYRPTGILKMSTQLSCKALFYWGWGPSGMQQS